MNPAASYSRTAMLLHWLIAAALAFQIGMGWRAEQLAQSDSLYDVLQLHKSIGITILLLTLLRLAIRFFKPPPPALHDEKWAHFLARLTHVLLYAFMIGAPLTGWLLASSSRLEIDTILFGAVPWPHVPGVETLAAEPKATVHEISETAHEYLAWLGVALFAMHVAGAIRHQFLKSEPLLARMLPVAAAHRKIAGSVVIASLALLFGLTAVLTREVGLDAALPAKVTELTNVPDQPAVSAETPPVPSEEAVSPEEVKAVEPAPEPVETIEPAKTEDVAAAPLPVPSWTVVRKDPIKFSVSRSGSAVNGSFPSWTANIKFAPEALDRSSAQITVNLASARTGDSSIDQALQGPDFFSTTSFSTATISLNRFRSLGGNRYAADGQMRLKNIARPVRVQFTLDISGSVAEANGTASISRSAHNVGAGDYADIADNVSVSFSFSAQR